MYDPNSSTIKTSLTLILQSLTSPTPWLVDVLEELVITALFRLECYVLRDDEFVSADAVQRLVDELFLMNAKELTSEFEGKKRAYES